MPPAALALINVSVDNFHRKAKLHGGLLQSKISHLNSSKLQYSPPHGCGAGANSLLTNYRPVFLFSWLLFVLLFNSAGQETQKTSS